MEVEHDLHASLLDLAAQADDIVEVLADALAFMAFRRILRVNEQPYTDGVPSLLFQERKQLHLPAVEVLIHSALLLIARQQRHVTAQQPLRLGISHHHHAQ